MAKKQTKKDVEQVKKTADETLIFRATRPLNNSEFKLMSEMVRHEQEKSGVKIVLMPYTSELVEDGKK